MPSFIYEFEELPLAIVDGIEAGLVNGQAEIDYTSAGPGWVVRDVSLEGFGERVNGKRQWPQVPAPEAIANVIRQRLNGEWYDKVYTAYSEQLSNDREDLRAWQHDRARALTMAE